MTNSLNRDEDERQARRDGETHLVRMYWRCLLIQNTQEGPRPSGACAMRGTGATKSWKAAKSVYGVVYP
ncbi:hypothetical protein AcW1_005306 [Taiwanofungus camphoratus]|nr:hypothetical protein AcW1_005306 [Antrodia cinnamomea]